MAEGRERRRVAAEVEAGAGERLPRGGRGLSEAATELALSRGQLSGWRTRHLAAGPAEAPAAREAGRAETRRLEREVGRVGGGCETLGRAAAFSARGIA